MTTATVRMSATEAAAAWLKAKGAARTKVAKFVADRAAESSRLRWKRLAAAMDANDSDRVAYYAATGDAKRAAAAKLKPAKAKTSPKTPAKAAPKSKPAPKAEPNDPLAAKLAGLAPEKRELAMTFLAALLAD